jgi:hypothetical protein
MLRIFASAAAFTLSGVLTAWQLQSAPARSIFLCVTHSGRSTRREKQPVCMCMRVGKCSFSQHRAFRSLSESAINPLSLSLAQSQIELKRSRARKPAAAGGSKKKLFFSTPKLYAHRNPAAGDGVELYCGFYEFFGVCSASFPGVFRRCSCSLHFTA